MARYNTNRDSRISFGVGFEVHSGALELAAAMMLTGKGSVEEFLTGTAPTQGVLQGDGVEDRLFEFKPYVVPHYPAQLAPAEEAFDADVWGEKIDEKVWQY